MTVLASAGFRRRAHTATYEHKNLTELDLSRVLRFFWKRKSSEEGLEQDFNSLHAQREACEAFIKSQQGEGFAQQLGALTTAGTDGSALAREVEPSTPTFKP